MSHDFAERVNGESFGEWYREREWARNIQKGKPYFNGPSRVPPPERHTPSSLLQCHRKIVYRQENAPAEQEEPEGIFWTGRQFEEDVISPFLRDVVGDDAYVRNSIWVDFEEETDAGVIQFKGATDPCIVDRDAAPILPTEVKTKDEVDYFDEPNRHHRAQVHAYMRGLSEKFDRDVNEAVIIYGGRTSMNVRAFREEFDEAFWREVVKWTARHNEYREESELPPADPEYDWECQFCDYRHRCGKSDEPYSDELPTGLLPGFADYPRERVVEYLEAHQGARLTPTLADVYPGLATDYDVAKWVCSDCTSEFDWDDDRFADVSSAPACPDCAQRGELAELRAAD